MKKNILYFLGIIVVSLVILFMFRYQIIPALGGVPNEYRTKKIKKQPNYIDGKLRNDLELDESLSAVMKAVLGERAQATRPEKKLVFSMSNLPKKAAELAVTWLGHSTVLVEIDGQFIIIDPMWSTHASPISGAGPERYVEPLLDLEDLPKLEAVVISHDHYDHLDMKSVQFLAQKGILFVVPFGIGAHLIAWGVEEEQIQELGWWEEVIVGTDLRIVCTPARHFSGREVADRFRTLWSGWVFIGEKSRVFFSGDSGMGPHFSEIGKRLGPFDLSMFEVGSYDPAWPDVHLGPEQALEAHRASNGNYMLPVHWSTFVMGNHGWTEPGERLLASSTPKDQLLLPKPGQRISLAPKDIDLPKKSWWPTQPWRTAEQVPIQSNQ